ncbi:type II toxin-antitoxin system prevent-host-death family antitoxin [Microbacterium phyllosphaerae]|uniref:type II toxin-antitoxin system prevent-host-death family antitoxin n=1 Tax=Microbacterium phyllosphaerae TaxID=124798 RepID=UPI000EA2C09E|nr:type II toxin-antitoxin system prevent-host-death family antitoxin [Microbacterium phyllosphaerae]
MTTIQPLTMSSTVAARRGIGFLTSEAQERPVKLTSHGKPVAVVVSAAEYDEQRRLLRDAELKVLSIAADLVADRSTMLAVDEARERLLAAG